MMRGTINELGTHQFLDDFALAYHRRVAEKLRFKPDETIETARRNLSRWRGSESFTFGESKSLRDWEEILSNCTTNRLIQILTDDSNEGRRLRQSSPFVGILSKDERLQILTECEKRATSST